MAEETFESISNALSQGDAVVLCVVVKVDGHAPRQPGAKMLVYPDGTIRGTIGGGRVEAEVITRAQALLASPSSNPEVVRYKLAAELGMCCGGAMDIYFEPYQPAPTLWLFGAGHVARATAPLARTVGFRVVVVDDRADWNSVQNLGEAVVRKVQPYFDVLASNEIKAKDYAVIVTRNHDDDQELLARLQPMKLSYLGMIGSKRKVERAFARLRADGVSEEQIAMLRAPVGIEIGAETPEEIAVSIIAEIIACRRGYLPQARALAAPKNSPG
jgi:xanthine dehydrogenase accessory factor